MKTYLALLLLLLSPALAFAGPSYPSSQVWTFDSRPDGESPYSEGSYIATLSVRKAETLPLAARLRVVGLIDGQGLMENQAPTPSPALSATWYYFSGQFSLVSEELFYARSFLVTSPGFQAGSLAGFDGVIDFKGASGFTSDWSTNQDLFNEVITDPSELAKLTGDGDPLTDERIEFKLGAFGGSFWTTHFGAGVVGSNTRLSSRVVVEYFY